MDDPVSQPFEIAEKIRKHGRRRSLRVMQQDDARMVFRRFETGDQEMALFVRAHVEPVRRPEIGSEDGNMLRVKQAQQGRRIRKAGEPEKRDMRMAGGKAAEP